MIYEVIMSFDLQEDISESIHERRKLRQLWSHAPPGKTREPGVGAELV